MGEIKNPNPDDNEPVVIEPEEPMGPKQGFDLGQFLVEPKTDYTGLIKSVDDKGLTLEEYRRLDNFGREMEHTPYADEMVGALLGKKGMFFKNGRTEEGKKETERALSFLKEKLKGKVLVDLGSGIDNSIFRLAIATDPSVFIGVDKFAGRDLSHLSEEGGMQAAGAKSDMLDFISRMPDNSANVTINGIDMNIIGEEKYHEALIREIIRVLPAGGIVFGRNSGSLTAAEDVLLKRKGRIDVDEETRRMVESSFRHVDFPKMSSDSPVVLEKVDKMEEEKK